MQKLKSRAARISLIALGCITLVLGITGIFLPLLPTTVFLLISAWAWMKSSDRFYTWLINNRLLGSYIRNYREREGITGRQKILTLSLLWVGIGYTALFIVSLLWLKLLLFGIAVAVTIHLLMLKTLPAGRKTEQSILVLCIHNSSRSQMAEAYIKRQCGSAFVVESAGIEPGTLNPRVVQVLAEDGIDISANTTQSVFDLHSAGRTFDYVIAVCSREAEEKCPIFPGKVERLHWPFDDPSAATGSEKEKLDTTRRIRDQIKEKVAEFCTSCGN